jgi:hypothetical protein
VILATLYALGGGWIALSLWRERKGQDVVRPGEYGRFIIVSSLTWPLIAILLCVEMVKTKRRERMENATFQKGLLMPCCAKKRNLRLSDNEATGFDKAHMTVRVCGVCGRRHFEYHAEPVRFGVDLRDLR